MEDERKENSKSMDIIEATAAEKIYDLTQKDKEEEEEYYELPEAEGKRSMIFSVAALICAILSVCLSAIYIPAIILAALAIGLSVFSRYRLGYFDKISLFGLCIAIFGVVFAVGAIVLDCMGLLDRLLGK